jgi:aerobic carbon-monoxide dehydrogenase medium subunit
MIAFDFAEPATLREAIGLLDPDDPTVRPIAGGTALMLMMKAGVFAPTRLVSLQNVEPQYSAIKVDGGALTIGALATLTSLERSKEVAATFPVISRTMVRLSNPRVRNVARVGGALAHGDPHMDLPPLLAALGARATLMGPNGSREIAVEELYTGYYETVIARDELITSVSVPALQGRKAAYVKVTSRTADDWPALGIAVVLASEGDKLKDIRLVASAATAMVTRLPAAEAVLKGKRADEPTLKQAGDAAAGEAPLLEDAHGSIAYKRELMRVYIGRAIRQALSGTPTH